MDEPSDADVGHMPRLGEHARDIPDRLLRLREVIGEKTAAVLLGEEAVEAPQALGQRPHIKKVDHQQIARLSALDTDRPGEKMHNGQIDVADIVGGFVVLDETAGPVIGLDHEILAGFDPGHDRDVRVPAVVDHVVLVGRLAEIDLDQRLRLPCQRAASRHHLIHSFTPLSS